MVLALDISPVEIIMKMILMKDITPLLLEFIQEA